MNNKIKEIRGISGSTLKIIAIVTMLIDHIGVCICYSYIQFQFGEPVVDTAFIMYQVMRMVGRIAFPIFCFLLVEGFFYTHSRKKYVLRLAAFAIISEIPFDLAMNRTMFSMTGQNVFFTLLIAFLMMMLIQEFREKLVLKNKRFQEGEQYLMPAIIFLVAAALAELLSTDYGMWGIIAIMGMYILRSNKKYMCLFEVVYFLVFEVWAVLSFIPIWFYNGKRGWKLKYIFYLFYPGHLLLLYFIYMQWIR